MEAAHVFYIKVRDLVFAVIRCSAAAFGPGDIDLPVQLIGRASAVSRITGFLTNIHGHMDITWFGRFRSQSEVFCLYCTSPWIMVTDTLYGQLAGFSADLCFYYIFRLSKIFFCFLLFLDHLIHNKFPDLFVLFSGRKGSIPVIAHPDGSRVVWSVSGKPEIIIVGGGAGLSSSRHSR